MSRDEALRLLSGNRLVPSPLRRSRVLELDGPPLHVAGMPLAPELGRAVSGLGRRHGGGVERTLPAVLGRRGLVAGPGRRGDGWKPAYGEP